MNNGMKRGLKWGIAVIIIGALGFSVMKALSGRKAQQEAVAAAAVANAKAQAVVELNSTDTVVAQVSDIAQGLPISGSLKAANSAFIKARVAGELQGLTVREGDSVKAGQVIARVEATEYAARLQQATPPKRKLPLHNANLTTTKHWLTKALSLKQRWTHR